MTRIDPERPPEEIAPDPRRVHLEPDVLPVGRLVGTLIGTAAITALCVVLSWGLMRLFESQLARPVTPISADARPPELFYNPIGLERPAPRLAEEAECALASYGWVDRDRGLVQIPIERAFDVALVLSGAPTVRHP